MVTNDEVLRALNSMRDSMSGQMGGLRSAVDHLNEEIMRHHARLTALEEAAAMPPIAVVPPELTELLTEVRAERAARRAKSEIRLEGEAEAAAAYLRSQRRRKAITWGFGVLFVAAQTAQLLRSVIQ